MKIQNIQQMTLSLADALPLEMLSRGAMKLLDLIQRFIAQYGKFHASQQWLADHFRRTTRTIRLWTEELRKAGFVKTKRRSQQSLLYALLTPKISGQISGQISGHISGHYKEELKQYEQREQRVATTQRKPPRRAYDPHASVWAKYGL